MRFVTELNHADGAIEATLLFAWRPQRVRCYSTRRLIILLMIRCR